MFSTSIALDFGGVSLNSIPKFANIIRTLSFSGKN